MPLVIITIIVASIISIIAGMIFVGHFFIYYSVVKFFGLKSNDSAKRWLSVALFFGAVSFEAAVFLAHLSPNVVTADFYILAGLWLGVALNLDVAFALAWIVFGAAKIFKKELNLKIIGNLALVSAVILSLYGVWNIYNPRVKEITVGIKNLPAAWENKKIVQLSDVHLGFIFGEKFFKKAVDKINIINPEAVFITGDLLDGLDGNLEQAVSPLNNLKAPGGTYFVTGNHETYFGLERTYDILATTKIKILNDEAVDLNGLQIVGVSFPEKSETKNIDETIGQMKGFDSGLPSVLLYHSPFEVDRARRAGISLMLSGHSHAGQMFPFDILAKIIFRGYDYGLHQENNFAIYTSSGLGAWGPMMRTFTRPEIVVITLENK